MQPKELARINELARKSKAEGLTAEEQEEQKRLRAAYIAAYRASLRSTLDSIVLVDEQGKQTPRKNKHQPKH